MGSPLDSRSIQSSHVPHVLLVFAAAWVTSMKLLQLLLHLSSDQVALVPELHCARIRDISALAELDDTSRSEALVVKQQIPVPIQTEFASECVLLHSPPADTLVKLGTKAARCACSKPQR